MPDEPDQPSKPSRSRPRLNDLAGETLEDELWNLDDDDSQPASVEVQPRNPKAAALPPRQGAQPRQEQDKAGEEAGQPPAAAEKPAAEQETLEPRPTKKQKPAYTIRPSEDEMGVMEEEADDTISATPEKAEAAEAAAPDDEPGPAAPPSPAPDEPGVADFEKEKERSAKAATDAPSLFGADPQKLEKIGLISLAVVVVGIAIWGITGLFSSVSTTELGEDFPDLPAKGEYATIQEVDTYWRQPLREGENPDAAAAGVIYIPVVSVTLDEGASGVLRILFRDETNGFVGDAISRSFSNGSFVDSGAKTAEFPATDGFHEISAFNGYRVGSERWTAEIYEGPSIGASGSEFKKLATTPLFPKTR